MFWLDVICLQNSDFQDTRWFMDDIYGFDSQPYLVCEAISRVWDVLSIKNITNILAPVDILFKNSKAIILEKDNVFKHFSKHQ